MNAYRRFLNQVVLPYWPAWALFASALMLAIAHAFQTFGHLQPCILCLKQRTVYWVAGSIALGGLVLQATPWRGWTTRLISAALGVCFLVGLGIAIWHAGAEWKFWPGPAACALNTAGVSAGDLAAALADTHHKAAPSCEQAAWRMFGISMAGYNAIISLKLVILSVLAAARRPAGAAP